MAVSTARGVAAVVMAPPYETIGMPANRAVVGYGVRPAMPPTTAFPASDDRYASGPEGGRMGGRRWKTSPSPLWRWSAVLPLVWRWASWVGAGGPASR